MKKSTKTVCLLLILLFCVNPIFGQSKNSSSKNDSFTHQHLEWKSKGVVKEYRIIIEEKQNGKYVEILNKTTKETYYDANLEPGFYRYKVYFYNVLGQLSFKTEYSYFEVKAAQKPKTVAPKYNTVYTQNNSTTIEIHIVVKDITSKTSFKLINLKDPSIEYSPLKVRIEENDVYLTFNKKVVQDGFYKVYIQNPEGLSTVASIVKVKPTKRFYYDFGAGLDSSLVMYDELLPQSFNNRFLPLRFTTDASVLYDYNENTKIGGELVFKINHMKNVNEYETLKANLQNYQLNGIYQTKLFSYKDYDFFLQAYGGLGISFLDDIQYTYFNKTKSDKADSVLPTLTVGANLKTFVYKNIYVKGGLDYTTTFSFGKADYSIGTLNLCLSGGFEL